MYIENRRTSAKRQVPCIFTFFSTGNHNRPCMLDTIISLLRQVVCVWELNHSTPNPWKRKACHIRAPHKFSFQSPSPTSSTPASTALHLLILQPSPPPPSRKHKQEAYLATAPTSLSSPHLVGRLDVWCLAGLANLFAAMWVREKNRDHQTVVHCPRLPRRSDTWRRTASLSAATPSSRGRAPSQCGRTFSNQVVPTANSYVDVALTAADVRLMMEEG